MSATTLPGTRTRARRVAPVASPPVSVECCDVGEPPGQVTVPDDEALALMAKALGHPARIRILRVLAQRQACVTGDVVAEIGLAQSTVSEHLRILRQAGLVRGNVEGPRTRYCVSLMGLAVLKAGVAAL